MKRALLVVALSVLAISLVALKSSAQSTSPRVSADEEVKVLKQLLSEANVKADRLAGQLSQMQQANQQLEQQIEKKDKEIARLQVRIASSHTPVIQFGDLSLRGIIDRLELRDGGLVVTDYKTGRPPSSNWELRSLAGVHFYAFLCQQVFGQLPVAVRLLYLSSGEIIEAVPSEQSARFVVSRTAAVWRAVEKACTSGTFTPRPGALCASCHYQRWCPAFGGDPDRAHLEAPVAFGLAAA